MKSWGYSHRACIFVKLRFRIQGMPRRCTFLVSSSWKNTISRDIGWLYRYMMIHVLDPVYIYFIYIYNVIIHKYTYSQGPDSVAKSEGNQNQPNSYRMQCILYVASPENWDCHFPMFKPIMFISGWSVIPIRWDFAWFALGACDLHPNAAEVVSGLPRAGAWQSQGGMLMI